MGAGHHMKVRRHPVVFHPGRAAARFLYAFRGDSRKTQKPPGDVRVFLPWQADAPGEERKSASILGRGGAREAAQEKNRTGPVQFDCDEDFASLIQKGGPVLPGPDCPAAIVTSTIARADRQPQAKARRQAPSASGIVWPACSKGWGKRPAPGLRGDNARL